MENLSVLFHSKMPLIYKDSKCLTISHAIGQHNSEKSLLDLGATINLLPYSVYKQLGLGELKSAPVIL